jgi:squalene-hopene/tetraprenyl-beta-curcumene cyclase
VRGGVEWLLNLQNADGGWPTFCRGWGKLPFDRSAPDLTAHVLRALDAWRDSSERMKMALDRGRSYLESTQRDDGSWVPLWFGNQQHPEKLNPVYGTARVLAAWRDLGFAESEPARRGEAYLVHAQDNSGGWGGDAGLTPSVEETALAVEALAHSQREESREACRHGAQWLVARVEDGSYLRPRPIGLYFAQLWYSEKLYPVIWTTAALGSVLAEDG